jgi:hypothetical protein
VAGELNGRGGTDRPGEADTPARRSGAPFFPPDYSPVEANNAKGLSRDEVHGVRQDGTPVTPVPRQAAGDHPGTREPSPGKAEAHQGKAREATRHEGKAPEAEPHEGRGPEAKSPEGRAPEGRTHEGRTHEGRTHEAASREAEAHVGEGRDGSREERLAKLFDERIQAASDRLAAKYESQLDKAKADY